MGAQHGTKIPASLRLAAFLGLVAAFSAYPWVPSYSIFHKPGPELPTYRAGDTFNYVNDRNEPVLRRVLRVQGDTVDWETETQYRFTSYRNLFLPRVQWDGEHSAGSMVSSPDPNVLWPLKKGAAAEVKVRYRRFDKKKEKAREYDQTWSCKVHGSQPVTVPAGTFDAFKVVCGYITKKGKKSKRIRTWYYAPEVGHYIKREREYSDSPTKTFELVSFEKAARG